MADKKNQNKKVQNKRVVKPQVTGDWLYFCPEEINVRALYEVLKDIYETEIWDEAGVLEVVLGEKSSFDMEHANIHPKDEITQQFANEQGAKSVFLATFSSEDYDKAVHIMRELLGKFGGLFCGDTEDFMPQLSK